MNASGDGSLMQLVHEVAVLRHMLARPGMADLIGERLFQEFNHVIVGFNARFPPKPPDELAEELFAAFSPTLSPTPPETAAMDYQQVHDFTAAGAERFASFLYDQGKPGLNVDAYRLSCLGSIEIALNETDDSDLTWTLSPAASKSGRPETFTADLDDIIVETVVLGHPE